MMTNSNCQNIKSNMKATLYHVTYNQLSLTFILRSSLQVLFQKFLKLMEYGINRLKHSITASHLCLLNSEILSVIQEQVTMLSILLLTRSFCFLFDRVILKTIHQCYLFVLLREEANYLRVKLVKIKRRLKHLQRLQLI